MEHCNSYFFVQGIDLLSVIEWLRERTEHLDIFLHSAHHSVVFYFRCSVYWWKGVSDFSVLKYYSLNSNHSVNRLSERLHIPNRLQPALTNLQL